MRNTWKLKVLLVVACYCQLSSSLFAQIPGPKPGNTVYLEQGWTADDREAFYYTAQGSELIPYQWFLHLEVKDKKSLFRDNRHLDGLRYIPRAASKPWNPNGLPVGFVEDKVIDPTQTASKIKFLKKKFNRKPTSNDQKTSMGLTCAACHTNIIEYGEKRIQIDGAPSMGDLQTFLSELAAAMDATLKDDAKFARFSKALGEQNSTTFKDEVESQSKALNELVLRNQTTTKYGFARLDAFGAILNAICDMGLEIPENRVESNAPVSYPFLWDIPQMDWVQWNSSSSFPAGRNVGEVLGVFGFFTFKDSTDKHQFDSTVKLQALIDLENRLKKLKAPLWPEDLLGQLDQTKVQKGKLLFAANCAGCHQVRKADGTLKMVKIGNQMRIKTVAIPFQEIETDPQMILNLGKTANPGVLKGMLPPPLNMSDKVPRSPLLAIAVSNVLKNRAEYEKVQVPDVELNGAPLPLGGTGYKSRHLEGIWATAPYLHNGSVPNLYELLLPASQRSKSFYVGSRKFDPKNVGFETVATPGAFEFKIADEKGPIVGNSNAGHEGPRNTQLFENGHWRDFNAEERWALVEYMKALGRPEAAAVEPAKAVPPKTTDTEIIPDIEAAQIDHIVSLTIQQLKNRYPAPKQILRGVHAKDHGCVKASFEVAADLPKEYQVGVFAQPGQKYEAMIRFSNASTLVLPDNVPNPTVFGSRGMAIKLTGVKGKALLETNDDLSQDFLMINSPVFAFANVEDYEILSQVLANRVNKESPASFFSIQIPKGGPTADRAKRSLGIVQRIQAPTVALGAFQPQPATPVDCRYFSGAAFLFGEGNAMKFSAQPVDPPANPNPDVGNPNYLREGLIKRLAPGDTAKPVVFKFQVQVRKASSLQVATDVEDACVEWPEAMFPFVDVATITIPPQAFDSPEQRAACEKLVFTPWHGVQEHRPLGGINRMRKAVYEASSKFRLAGN